MTIEAMKQALGALETYHGYMEPLTTVFGGPRVPAEQSTTGKVEKAITSLCQAIEQAEKQEPVAAKKDAVFDASIQFIGTLTGMKPPPIETSPPEIFKPFRDFTEKVCSIFTTTPQPQRELNCVCGAVWEGDEMVCVPHKREWVGLTGDEIWQLATDCTIGGDLHADKFARATEAKLKEKNT